MTQPSPVFELRVVLTADNYDAAVRFYRDVLGLPLIREFDDGSLLAAGQATVEVLSRGGRQRKSTRSSWGNRAAVASASHLR